MFISVPTNIVEFAYHSRIDSGCRLLECCLQHSFDSKTSGWRNSKLQLVQVKSDRTLGLSFKHQVHASMKNDFYDREIIVSLDKILISKCTGKVGGGGNERIVCVHSLVPLYLFTILLTGGHLAEHTLI